MANGTGTSGGDGKNGHPPPAGSRGYGREISMTGPGPLMWTVQAVAKALEVSDDYVYGLVQRHEIPFVRFGTNIRFHYADVRAFVNRLRDASLGEDTDGRR
jgi:excisionase family DNA binding protein